MGIEVERKYLVSSQDWRAEVVASTPMVQGYVAVNDVCNVRVRVAGDAAYLTIKGRRTDDRRPEFEYQIPVVEAREILVGLCGGKLVEKVRHRVSFHGLIVEVDEFSGANSGLVLAEVERPPDVFSPAVLPDWIGMDVTDDERYYNAHLNKNPHTCWI